MPQLTDGCADRGCLQRIRSADRPLPTTSTTGAGINGQAAQEARPYFTRFPYIGFINQMSNNTRSNYNSLQATLTKRMSHGLSFIAGYTYAHGLDNGSLNRFGMIPQDGTADQYANSDFDVRHRFTLSATYNIPGIKGFGQVLEGWQINTIVNIQSSQPWRVNDGGNNFNGTNDNADLWNFTGNPASFKAGFNSIPYCTGALTLAAMPPEALAPQPVPSTAT